VRERKNSHPLIEYPDSYPDYITDHYPDNSSEPILYSDEYIESLEQKISDLNNGYKELNDDELSNYFYTKN
jgi:hypothetical protein